MEENVVKLYVSGNVPGEPVSAITAEELRQLLIEVLGISSGEQDVSGNGISCNSIEPEKEVLIDSVSSISVSDNTVSDNTVSGNTISGNGILDDIYAEMQTLQKENPPIWEKPLEDYTVTEGLLLLMLMLLLGIFASHILKGGEKYV